PPSELAHTHSSYTLSLHDALPILDVGNRRTAPLHLGAARLDPRKRRSTGSPSGANHSRRANGGLARAGAHIAADAARCARSSGADRKSTRLNSSHEWISYAVFCLK